VCECDAEWMGPDCNSQHVMLSSGQVVNGIINQTNEWRYYHFKSNATTFIVSLKEEGFESTMIGMLYLLVAERYEPNLRSYDYMDVDLNRGFHTLTIILDNRPGEQIDWIIGVYGSVYLNNPLNFKLLVWQPPPL